ncbi:Cullin [Zopfochytrium polystomum]|nr:Cullin [Zopfochytrium polystomum]
MNRVKHKPIPKIKPVKKATEPTFNEAWEKLSTAILEIYRKNASSLSFEELYRNAYLMVIHKHGDKLYNGVEGAIRDHLNGVTRSIIVPAFPIRKSASSSSASSSSSSNKLGVTAEVGALVGGPDYLKTLRSVWEDHSTCMIMIRDILFYMDRVYVKPANKHPVYDLGMVVFRDAVLSSKSYGVLTATIETILDQILLEREGEMIDRLCMKSMVDMMLSLNMTAGTSASSFSSISVYDQHFEPIFISSSREYYSRITETLLTTCDAREYMLRVERLLADESNRVRAYLSNPTEPKIRTILEELLIANNLQTIIEMPNSGMVTMMTNEKVEDLQRMYHLFSRAAAGHQEMRSCISSHIAFVGRGINESVGGIAQPSATGGESQPSANPVQWVESLLSLKDKFDRILEAAFDKDKAMINAVNSALMEVLNANPRAPEYLSLFIDDNLKKSVKGKTEAEIDAILDKTVVLFRFISEKDVFERYYKQHLAKRLLQGRSASEDSEKSFIAKLKLECGSQFTSKLEGMFNDMRLSQDTMVAFRQHLENSGQGNSLVDISGEPVALPDLSVNVLTSSFWPNTNSIPCQFPPLITHTLERFQRFYLNRHSGRRMTWLAHMGTADLRANLPRGRKEINVSSLMMVILLTAFNYPAGDSRETQAYTLRQISEATGVPVGNELRRGLQSLSLGKHKILTKTTKGKDVSDTDGFLLNLDFSSPLNKIKILTISAGSSAGGGPSASTDRGGGEDDGERRQTMERVEEARRLQVEAVVVRIMKSRKTMDHNNLVAEVISQLTRFSPSPAMVKKRIESLIEREYLERDANERKMYRYLA